MHGTHGCSCLSRSGRPAAGITSAVAEEEAECSCWPEEPEVWRNAVDAQAGSEASSSKMASTISKVSGLISCVGCTRLRQPGVHFRHRPSHQ